MDDRIITSDEAPDLAAILRGLLRESGHSILASRDGLHDALRAGAHGQARSIHLLMNAFDAGVPRRLLALGREPTPEEIGHETTDMVDHFGSSAELAREAVGTWGAALWPSPFGPASAAGATPPLPLPAPAGMPAAAAPVTTATPPPPPIPLPPTGMLTPGTVQALPAAPAATGVLPLPSPAGAASSPPPPFSPAVGPGGAPAPTPIRRLPGAVGSAATVRTLPGAGAGAPGAARPGAVPTPHNPALRIVAAIVGIVLIGGLSYGLYGLFAPKPGIRVSTGSPGPEHGPEPGPAPGPSPSSGPKPSLPGPSPTGPKVVDERRTAEGFPVATTTEPGIRFPASRIDGNPNTLLFTFGLAVAQQTLTYQAAFGFEGRSPNGKGLVKAIKGGEEATTGEQDVTRIVREDGTTGFTLSSKLSPNPISAPAICLSVLAGKPQDRLDLANGAGYFCAFGTDQNGYCDGNVRLGCGDLYE